MEDDPELELIRRRKLESLQRYAAEVQVRSGFPDHVVHVTDLDFNEQVARYPLAIVDFWATWCQPCKMVTAVIDALSREMQGKVVFLKLDVDANPMTTKEHNVMSVPTLMIYRDGKMVDRFVGAQTKASLKERILRHMPAEE